MRLAVLLLAVLGAACAHAPAPAPAKFSLSEKSSNGFPLAPLNATSNVDARSGASRLVLTDSVWRPASRAERRPVSTKCRDLVVEENVELPSNFGVLAVDAQQTPHVFWRRQMGTSPLDHVFVAGGLGQSS